MADYDPDYEVPDFDDGSPLARAEIEMMQSLAPEQAELVARWMTLYGYAWESETAQRVANRSVYAFTTAPNG